MGNFRSLGPKRGWVHGESFDPQTEALKAAGDRCVELHDPRTSGADFKMEPSNPVWPTRVIGVSGASVRALLTMPRARGRTG